jgi:hypothetical protein
MPDLSSGWWVDGTPLSRWASGLTVVGDETPARRGTNLPVAGKAGTVWRRKVPTERRQTFVLKVHDRDEYGRPGAMDANLDALKLLWNGDGGQVEIVRRITMPDGQISTRTGHGEVVDVLAPQVVRGRRYATLAVDLLMADPYWYEPSTTRTGLSGTFRIVNRGTARATNPVVTISGPATNPTLTNTTTGSSVTYTGTLSGVQSVTINSGAYTAVNQAGVSVLAAITRGSVAFVEIAPGPNVLTLTSGTCSIAWRAAFL